MLSQSLLQILDTCRYRCFKQGQVTAANGRFNVDTETFLRRIQQEGGVSKGVSPEGVVIAVFSTVREELTPERIEEISGFLPDGLKVMWEQI